MIETVELVRGGPTDHSVLERLVQFYIHDFSDFLAPGRVLLRDDGYFDPFEGLDSYWTLANRAVWFVRANGALAGFALVNDQAHSGRAVDYNVGEFFIARPYRRSRVGARAVRDLLNAHPGVWEVAIAARNEPAQLFWPSAIAGARIGELETLAGDGVRWMGPILRFAVRGIASPERSGDDS